MYKVGIINKEYVLNIMLYKLRNYFMDDVWYNIELLKNQF
jgi:hypothetical protein